MQLRLAVDVGQCATGLRASRTAKGIHPHASEQRHVDHHAGLAYRKAGYVVSTPANGHEKLVLVCKTYRIDHVDSPRAANDQTGPTVDHRIPDLAQVIVFRVFGSQNWASEYGLERLKNLLRDVHGPAVQSCKLDCHDRLLC